MFSGLLLIAAAQAPPLISIHSYLIFFNVALPQQGIRKVLDVKFHPEGLPQLVSSSNEVSAIYDSCFIYYSRIPSISYYCKNHYCTVLSTFIFVLNHILLSLF
jgi:hypothetical protein